MTTPTTERPPASAGRSLPRLQQRYRNEIVPALRDEFKIANVMQTPNLVKIVVNMGVGEAARDSSPGRANPSRSSSCGKA
jgi:large subunit ribosomal protein L5